MGGTINSRVFISGSTPQRDYLAGPLADLSSLGFVTFASWRQHEDDPETAVSRWTELLMADITVCFDSTENCLIEVGASLGLTHHVVCVGLDKNIESSLLWLPTIDHFQTWDEAVNQFFGLSKTLHIKRRNKKVSL